MSTVLATDVRLKDLTPAELQAAARDAYRCAAANGDAPTGAVLGSWFGRSDRWGRDRIAECRAEDNRLALLPITGNGDGTGSATVLLDDGDDGSDLASTVPSSAKSGSREVDPDAMRSRRVIRWVTTAAVIVVAACAARSSYEHQRTVVEMAGNHEAAWYLPLSVDGMMLIASLNMLVRRWDGQRAGWLTWTALLLGGAASLAANIAAAPPTWIGRLVAAWSPVCLIVSYELLMQQLPDRAPAPETEGRQR